MALSENLMFKAKFGDDVRRFALPTSALSFSWLEQKIRSLFFADEAVGRFAVKYEDDEGDLITLSSDEELFEAARSASEKTLPGQQVVRLSVHRSQAAAPALPPKPAAAEYQPRQAPQERVEEPVQPTAHFAQFLSKFLSNQDAVRTLDSTGVSGPLFKALPELLNKVLSVSDRIGAFLNSPAFLDVELPRIFAEALPRLPHIAAVLARDEVDAALTVHAPQLGALLRSFLQANEQLWVDAKRELESNEYPPFTPFVLMPLLPYVLPVVGSLCGDAASGFCGDAASAASGFCGPSGPLSGLAGLAGLGNLGGLGGLGNLGGLGGLAGLFGGAPQGQSPCGPRHGHHHGAHHGQQRGCGGFGRGPFRHPFFAGACHPRQQQQQQQTEEPEFTPTGEAIHHRVACDGCGAEPIVGARFNCTVCENFDLCTRCENQGTHDPRHPLVKIPLPRKRFAHGGFAAPAASRPHVEVPSQAASTATSAPTATNPAPIYPQQPSAPTSARSDSGAAVVEDLESKLQQLEAMGFYDRGWNTELLRKNYGNMSRTVQQLLGQ
eukprot:TRINITY_DN4773_c0_g1_i1.p1 TRINITY_DN4773_c0_g1~~TRINITY_DN4773_c0_g1_i1.p1  ORF type:complete len:551 (+),score=146.50 TRINITY_DN4773_c0_g1_i1:183-1835(+)